METLAFQGNPCFDVLTATSAQDSQARQCPWRVSRAGPRGDLPPDPYGRGGERDEVGWGYNRCPIQPRVTLVESVTLARDWTATANGREASNNSPEMLNMADVPLATTS